MKISTKFFVISLLAILIWLPTQAAQAKSLPEGPIFGSNFTLKSGETLNEDLVVFGGSVAIEKDASVNGAVVLFGGSLTLNGNVSKDVVVLGGAVRLEANTHIQGNLVTFGAAVSRDPAARVDGDVMNNPTRPASPAVPVLPGIPSLPQVVSTTANPFWSVISTLGQSIILALLAMLIALFLPMHMRRVADGVVAQPFMAFGMGLLSLVMFIIAIVALALFSILIITLIVTIPLIACLAIVFSAACVMGWLALGLEIGLRISEMFKREIPLPLAAGLGVFCLNLVAQGVGFIPCIGGLLAGLIGFAGLGAVVMTRFGMRVLQPIPIKPMVVAPPVQES